MELEMGRERSSTLNLLCFFTATFLVFINFYTSFTVLPLYIEKLGGTEFQIGLQSTIFLLTAVLLRLYFGPLADSRGRKLPLLVGAITFGTAPLLFLGSKTVFILTLARIYQAVGLASYFSSASSYISDVAPPGKLGIYIGLHRLIITLALLIGSPLSIFVLNNSGYRTWFLLSFLLGLPAVALIALLKVPDFAKIPEGTFNSLQYVADVLQNRRLWIIFAGIALASLCYGSLLTFATVYIADVTEITNPGIYFTLFAIASIAANLGAGYVSDILGRQIVIWPAVFLLGLGTASLVLLPQASFILYFSSIVGGLGFAAGLPVLIAWLVETVDKRFRATAISVQESTIDIASAFGSLLVGFASELAGLHLSFAGLGILISLLAGMIFIKNRF
ncbi:MAG: MFS transporter [Peptococcaceae bacterium]